MSDGGGLHGESVAGHVDEIGIVGGELAMPGTVPQGCRLSIRGWALNRRTGKPVDRLRIAVADGPLAEAVLEFRRQDVADGLEWATSEYGGFYAVIPVDCGLGSQPVTVMAYCDDNLIPLDCGCKVEVGPTLDQIAGYEERSEGWAFAVDGFFTGDRRFDVADQRHTAIVAYELPSILKLWIIDLKEKRPPASVVARLGGSYLPVFDGTERPDAAASVGVLDAHRCGFSIPVVPALSCTSLLQLYALSTDGGYLRLPGISVRQANPLPSDALPQNAAVQAHVDEIRIGDVSSPFSRHIAVKRGAPIIIRGWAVDEVGPRLPGSIEALIDGAKTVAASNGGRRSDIADLFGNTAIADCEFEMVLDTSSWRDGRHHVGLRAFSARGDHVKKFANISVIVQP